MLEAKLQEIELGIQRRYADGLLANGRFLRERLSPPAADLGLHPETRGQAKAEEQELRTDRPN